MKAHHELPLFSGSIYHVYNRTNKRMRNCSWMTIHRQYFLSRYQRYMSPLVDTYAYCLLSNHFHFLIKVKPMKDLLQVSKDTEKMMKGGLVSEYFRRFFYFLYKSI
jgi:putative transposase